MTASRYIRDHDHDAPPWDRLRVPTPLLEALDAAAAADPVAAETILSSQLEAFSQAPELWWALAVCQAAQEDELNADLCLGNFRIELARTRDLAAAVARTGEARLALDLFIRMGPCQFRAADAAGNAEYNIGLAGAAIGCDAYDLARKAIGRAYGQYRALAPRRWAEIAEVAATRAALAHAQGDFRRSLRRIRWAVALADHDPLHVFRRARLRRDLGVVYSELRRDADAERWLRAALLIAEDGGDRDLAASIRTELADHQVNQRCFAEALETLQSVIDIVELPNSLRADALHQAAACRFHIGRTLHDDQQLDEAERLTADAIALRTHGRPDFVADAEFLLQGQIALARGRVDVARAAAVKALRAMRRAGRPNGPSRGRAETLVIGIRIAEGRLDAADRWARAALARRLQMADPATPQVLDAQMLCAGVAHRLGHSAEVRERLQGVVQAEAVSLQRLFDQTAGPADWARLRLANEASEALAALEWSQLDTDSGARSRLVGLLLSRRGLGRALRNTQRFARAQPIWSYSAEAIASAIGPGAALIAVVAVRLQVEVDPDRAWAIGFGPPQAVAVGVRQGEPALLINLGPMETLERSAQKWRAAVRAGRKDPTDLGVRLAPLRRWAEGQRIYWMGEGAFEALPLSAWLGPETWIAQLQNIHDRVSPSADEPVRLLAAVSDAFMEGDLPAAHVGAEIASATDAAGRLGGVSQVLLNPQPETVAAALADGGWSHLHLIAHGEALPQGAVSSDDPYDGAALAFGDGALRAAEVARLDLRELRLAVLSSCVTGRGIEQFAEGAASLAGAILDAGGEVAIGSLWPVPDADTARFMQAFYALGEPDPAARLAKAKAVMASAGDAADSWATWTVFTHLLER
jgi:tetratricopeptide (TPR) repeat protein